MSNSIFYADRMEHDVNSEDEDAIFRRAGKLYDVDVVAKAPHQDHTDFQLLQKHFHRLSQRYIPCNEHGI